MMNESRWWRAGGKNLGWIYVRKRNCRFIKKKLHDKTNGCDKSKWHIYKNEVVSNISNITTKQSINQSIRLRDVNQRCGVSLAVCITPLVFRWKKFQLDFIRFYVSKINYHQKSPLIADLATRHFTNILPYMGEILSSMSMMLSII